MINLEEFMIFEDEDGEKGIIISTDNNSKYVWWKCFRTCNGGQIFSENDECHQKILKLYRCKHSDSIKYCALRFMQDGKLDNYSYDCVYHKKDEYQSSIDATINIITNSVRPEDLEKIMLEIQKKFNNLNYNIK